MNVNLNRHNASNAVNVMVMEKFLPVANDNTLKDSSQPVCRELLY
jgi:hypothetical protein